jgi:glycosyltransferase involved in cell wall biosynthesis
MATRDAEGLRKILLISYHFPPSMEVGALRVSRFAKYLPSSGWEPVVLTIDEKYLASRDAARLEALGKLKVIRTSKLPTPLDGYENLRRVCSAFVALLNGKPRTNGRLPTRTEETTRESLVARIKRYLLSLILVMPDTENGWILPAAFRALREIRRERIDCILTSCPPYSVHLVGLLIKCISNVKWVADFRDPWMATRSKKLFPTCRLSMRIESWLEKKVIEKADLALFNVQSLRDLYRKIYVDEPAEKFQYIPNSIETEMFHQIRELEKFLKFTLTYIGSLYLGRTPEPVFKALKILADAKKIDLNTVSVRLIGNCRLIDDRSTADLIDQYGLHNVVETIDPLPYNAVLPIVAKSHVALLFAPEQPLQIPAKLYDYLGCGTRILAITGEGATSDFIHATGCGRAFASTDIDGIKEYLFEVMNDSCQIAARNDFSDALYQYNASAVTKQLADKLNSMLSVTSQSA